MNKTIKREEMVKKSNQSQQLPFDVQNNIKLLKKQLGSDNESLMEWVKKQPNFKGVIPFKFTPIVENQKQYDSYNFEIDDDIYYIQERKLKEIPLVNLEITTDKDCNINSLTMIMTKNGKPYKVISQKDYGIIKSRYLLDSNGKIKNYDKCDLIPFDGEYKEYRMNTKNWGNGRRELNKVFNFKNGVKHGECKTYYKGEYPWYYNSNNMVGDKTYWYEMFTFNNGVKDGLYENTKKLERGILKNGKRVGEWIVELPKECKVIGFNDNRRTGESYMDRIKCNYMDYKLEGKWEGVKREEFFNGTPQPNQLFTPKIGGEFKNGIMEGEFYSVFWREDYNITNGSYENNKHNGKWVTKHSDKVFSDFSFNNKKSYEKYKKEHPNKPWRTLRGKEYFSSDEVKDYTITETIHDGNNTYYPYGTIETKKEVYENKELVGVYIHNTRDMNYSIELDKGINPFNEYTKDWIPNEYKNKGFSITYYSGRNDGKRENDVIHFNINEENFLGYNGLNDNILLNNGYPYTHEGIDRRDGRKKTTYPTLPSNHKDFIEMGKYLSSTYELGDIKLKLISIDGEIFEQNRFEKNTDEFKSKRNQVIKKVIKLLSEERKKELSEIKKEESKDFTLFPMD